MRSLALIFAISTLAATGARARDVACSPLAACPPPLKGVLPDFWRGSVLGDWEPPSAIEWGIMGTTTGLIIVDLLQTNDCLYHHPGNVKWVVPGKSFLIMNTCSETNPLLGPHPGRPRLWGSALGGTALMIALWYVLPPKWRNLHVAAEGAVEVGQVIKAGADGLSFRF